MDDLPSRSQSAVKKAGEKGEWLSLATWSLETQLTLSLAPGWYVQDSQLLGSSADVISQIIMNLINTEEWNNSLEKFGKAEERAIGRSDDLVLNSLKRSCWWRTFWQAGSGMVGVKPEWSIPTFQHFWINVVLAPVLLLLVARNDVGSRELGVRSQWTHTQGRCGWKSIWLAAMLETSDILDVKKARVMIAGKNETEMCSGYRKRQGWMRETEGQIYPSLQHLEKAGPTCWIDVIWAWRVITLKTQKTTTVACHNMGCVLQEYLSHHICCFSGDGKCHSPSCQMNYLHMN